MLKHLRRRFVALTMVIVGVVLTCVSAAICISDYQRSVADVYGVLEGVASPLYQTIPAAPEEDASGETGDAEGCGAKAERPDEAGDDARGEAMIPVIGGKEPARDRVIPVAAYTLADGGAVEIIDASTTASIDDDVLEEALAAVADAPDGHGSLSSLGLLYAKRTYEVDGSSEERIAFADQSAVSSWQWLALICAGVEAAALVVFLVISWVLSKWALKPVERAWSQQRQFVADASHELKTPIAVILANTSILGKHADSSVASQMQWIESTSTEAHRMGELVGDMLELAALDDLSDRKSPVSPSNERIDFSDLVEGVVLQFESIAFERAIDLDSDVERALFVTGDATRLARMATTLVENACKYAGAGGSVRVELHARAGSASLSIRNSGTPIPPEDLPHVFDRFYRADKARSRGVGGYGLGLSIAQGIARAHGGAITVRSSQEDGTTFTATLPTC